MMLARMLGKTRIKVSGYQNSGEYIMIKYGGFLLALSGVAMPYDNAIEYALGGVLIFVGSMIVFNGR